MEKIDKVELEEVLTNAKYQEYKDLFEKYGIEEAFTPGKKKSELIKAGLDQLDKVRKAEEKEQDEKEAETEEDSVEVETDQVEESQEAEADDEYDFNPEPPHKVPEKKVDKEVYEKQLATVKLCIMNENNENKLKVLKRKMYDLEDKLGIK